MRVIHFVPSAFEYFEDIRSGVFKIVEELDKLEINSEIITLQYDTPTKAEQHAAQKQEMARSYHGVIPDENLLFSLQGFDIIHFHLPGLGFLGKFLKWQRNNLKVRVVVTYYHPVRPTDLVSYFVAWYNRTYLPRLAKIACGFIYFSEEKQRPVMRQLQPQTYIFDARNYVSWPLSEKTGSIQFLRLPELAETTVALYEQVLYT